ncbi:MAG: walK [Candidatus Taylorbacteria bacterium]|nr:walK [Candidatus Taylorbacteria bacterium]
MNKKFSLYSKFFVTAQTIVILLMGAGLSWYFGYIVYENEKSALINRVYNIATTLDSDTISGLRGDPTDLSNPNYVYLKKKLVDLRNVNTDARFLYVLGYRPAVEKLFFYADSESPDSVDTYSPPGELYNQTTKLEIDNFLRGIAFAENPYSDDWGRWVSASAPIISSETGLPIAMVGIDIDASKLIKDIVLVSLFPFIIAIILAILFFVFHKMRMREKLNELNNVKLEFSSFMSHEIRGFVTKVKGGLRALEHEDFGILTPDQSSYVKDMIVQSDEFAELVEEFLDVGHLEQDIEMSLLMENYNILDILKRVVADIADTLHRKEISIIYEGNIPDKVYCPCDNNKMGRVFSNILLNAAKYSPEKSSIRIGYVDANTSHTIYIKDSGIGIPDSQKESMFKKFFRANNARDIHTSGTGLGLYFSKLIVEKHRGRIWYESVEGNGTTFYISLPKQ